ncbi:DUF1995 family protein [Chroococcidiopsis sp.]|uniref:DUF1995 family protein n=1 Tax=Chroococcidiopsis sp. TaxID=3088168 RepID=UPI003F3CC55B
MTEFPKTLEQAIAQAAVATSAAIADGYTRLQVELAIPELKPMSVAEQFLAEFTQFGSQLKVFFPDAGAAALARRDWGEVPFKIVDIGTRSPLEEKIEPEDGALLFVSPSAVEVERVEKLCELATCPTLMLNPRLEDVAIVGIGYAGRQLRTRFLNNIESCYYLRPIENISVFRSYPGEWQIWREVEEEFQLIAEQPTKPMGDEIDAILYGGTSQANTADAANASGSRKPGIFASMQRFLRTLSR